MFNIELDSKVHSDDESQWYEGRITLGDHSEIFLASAQPWTPDQYRRQWQAAARALASGATKTAFVTSFVHPDAHHNFVWAAWRAGELVYVQEILLLRDSLPNVLDVDHIERFVPQRHTKAEDGYQISEWVVSIDHITAFAASDPTS